jgi:hypothetical protein
MGMRRVVRKSRLGGLEGRRMAGDFDWYQKNQRGLRQLAIDRHSLPVSYSIVNSAFSQLLILHGRCQAHAQLHQPFGYSLARTETTRDRPRSPCCSRSIFSALFFSPLLKTSRCSPGRNLHSSVHPLMMKLQTNHQSKLVVIKKNPRYRCASASPQCRIEIPIPPTPGKPRFSKENQPRGETTPGTKAIPRLPNQNSPASNTLEDIHENDMNSHIYTPSIHRLYRSTPHHPSNTNPNPLVIAHQAWSGINSYPPSLGNTNAAIVMAAAHNASKIQLAVHMLQLLSRYQPEKKRSSFSNKYAWNHD